MGVNIDFNLAMVVPFTDYELVDGKVEQVRYDQFTGNKEVTVKTHKNLFYKGQKIEGRWELKEIIGEQTGLELIYRDEFAYGKDDFFIGKYLVAFDQVSGASERVNLETLKILEEEIINKMTSAGYKMPCRPYLYAFVDYS